MDHRDDDRGNDARDPGGRDGSGGDRDGDPRERASRDGRDRAVRDRNGGDRDARDRFADDPRHADRPYRFGAPARERVDAPETPGRAPLLTVAGRGEGASGRRSRARTGEPVDSRPAEPRVTDLALAATLRTAALHGGRLTRAALREHVRSGREGNLVVFCVDASGSMGARRRMAHVKGAVLGLLTDAYQRRDRVALVTFRDEAAQVVLPPTGSVERAAAALAQLPTGGRTPLAAGLRETEQLIRTEARRDPSRRALAVVVTDGRAADPAAAWQAAASLATAAGVVVLDGEAGPVRLGLAARLAEAARATLLPLEAAA